MDKSYQRTTESGASKKNIEAMTVGSSLSGEGQRNLWVSPEWKLPRRHPGERPCVPRLEELEHAPGVPPELVAHSRAMYQLRVHRYRSRLDAAAGGLVLELLRAERQVVVAMRGEGLISDDAKQRVERSLDYEELKLST